MNADKFSLKARRSTRIPLRIPVHLVVQVGGQARSFEAWTMIVNIHGAKVECRRPFESGDEVLIQVPFNGKAQKGKVVGGTLEANNDGNYEFGVELENPEDLWGVGFPPSDWKTNRTTITPATAEPRPNQTVSEGTTLESDPSPLPEQSTVEIPAQNQAAEPAGEPAFPHESAVPAGSCEPIGEDFHSAPVLIRMICRYSNGIMVTYGGHALAYDQSSLRVLSADNFEKGINLSVMASFLDGIAACRVASSSRCQEQPGRFELELRFLKKPFRLHGRGGETCRADKPKRCVLGSGSVNEAEERP